MLRRSLAVPTRQVLLLVAFLCPVASTAQPTPADVAVLIEQLSSPSFKVFVPAAERLYDAGGEARQRLFDALPGLPSMRRVQLLSDIAQHGGDVLDYTMGWFRSTAPNSGEWLYVLREAGEPGRAALHDMLANGTDHQRVAAARGLRDLRHMGPDTARRLAAALSDVSAAARLAAADALYTAEGPPVDVLEALGRMVDTGTEMERATAFATLCRLNGLDGLGGYTDAFIKLLRSPDVEVRKRASSGLDLMGSGVVPRIPEALAAPVVALLSDHNAYVRQVAYSALSRTKDGAVVVPLLAAQLESPISLDAAALLMTIDDVEGRRAALPVLIRALESGDPKAQARACSVLRWDGPAAREVSAQLVVLLGSENEAVRRAALDSLTAAAHPAAVCEILRRTESFEWDQVKFTDLRRSGAGAVPVLLDILREGPADVRPKACRMLPIIAGITSPDENPLVFPAVAACLSADDAALRKAAVDALLMPRLPGMCNVPGAADALPQVIPLLNDPDEGVRCSAAAALAFSGREEARPVLIALADTASPEDACLVGVALVEIGEVDRAIVPLCTAVATSHAAIRKLGELGTRASAAAPTLIETLRTPRPEEAKSPYPLLRSAAAHALVAIGDSQAALGLCEFLAQDGDVAVRTEVALALQHWGVYPDPSRATPPRPTEQTLAGLLDAMRTVPSTTRLPAALALIRLGGDRQQAFAILESLRDDSDVEVAAAARDALTAYSAR